MHSSLSCIILVPIDNSKEEGSDEIVHLRPNRGISHEGRELRRRPRPKVVIQNMKGISLESRGSNLTLPPSVKKATVSVLETFMTNYWIPMKSIWIQNWILDPGRPKWPQKEWGVLVLRLASAY
jgi:hypothetical protein